MTIVPSKWVWPVSLENVEATCPCGYLNKFNRASDLGGERSFSNKRVSCKTCNQPFDIVGDIGNPLWELLILECDGLIQEQRYRICILNLAQSFEVFFAQYLRVKLLYRPFAQDFNDDSRWLKLENELTDLFHQEIKDLSYSKLRAVFSHYVLANRDIPSLNAAKSEILSLSKLPQLKQSTKLSEFPSNEDIGGLQDEELGQILVELRDNKVVELRNKVVHKEAYLPTLEEVNSAKEKTENILNFLRQHLKVWAENIWQSDWKPN